MIREGVRASLAEAFSAICSARVFSVEFEVEALEERVGLGAEEEESVDASRLCCWRRRRRHEEHIEERTARMAVLVTSLAAIASERWRLQMGVSSAQQKSQRLMAI